MPVCGAAQLYRNEVHRQHHPIVAYQVTVFSLQKVSHTSSKYGASYKRGSRSKGKKAVQTTEKSASILEGLCKRARIRYTHVLIIYAGYRVPLRAVGTRYVKKKRRQQYQHRHSVIQSFLYVKTIYGVEPIAHRYT